MEEEFDTYLKSSLKQWATRQVPQAGGRYKLMRQIAVSEVQDETEKGDAYYWVMHRLRSRQKPPPLFEWWDGPSGEAALWPLQSTPTFRMLA
ncbi:MAG: hypothetical protein AB1894_07945 [Chloroflexota bacterium]